MSHSKSSVSESRADAGQAGLVSAELPVGAATRSLVGVTFSVGDNEDSAPGTEPQARPQAEQKLVVES